MGTLDLALIGILQPFVIAFTQLLKKGVLRSTRWAPLLSLVWGTGFAFATVYGLGWTIPATAPNVYVWIVLHGLTAGLVASGCFSLASKSLGIGGR